MAAASRVVTSMRMPDGTTATLAINYEDLTLAVTGMTVANPSAYIVTAHLWQSPGNINKLGKVLAGVLSQLFPLSGAGIILLSDLTLPAPWEIGMGVIAR